MLPRLNIRHYLFSSRVVLLTNVSDVWKTSTANHRRRHGEIFVMFEGMKTHIGLPKTDLFACVNVSLLHNAIANEK